MMWAPLKAGAKAEGAVGRATDRLRRPEAAFPQVRISSLRPHFRVATATAADFFLAASAERAPLAR